MALVFHLAFFSVLIMAASLSGGLAPAMMRFTHRGLHLLISFVAGLMLGVGVFHLWPHATEKLNYNVHAAAGWLMAGLLGMFFLIRAFHFHQHASLEPDDAQASGSNAESKHSGCLVHDHDHDGTHSHASRGNKLSGAHQLSWVGIGFGLAVHTLIDGMALAASVQSEMSLGGTTWVAGVATFMAIVLHKPLDAMSITTLMASSGWSPRSRMAANMAFAVMCPIGVILFFVVESVLPGNGTFLGAALAVSAGVFLCISLSDLLPEIQFHHHDRLQLSLVLLAGVLIAWALVFIEPRHSRKHQPVRQLGSVMQIEI